MAEKWVKLSAVAAGKLTPMLRQYLQAKAECGDSLLFFRMGDFFELFFEDAIEAAEILGLALTSRDGAAKDQRVPMCGVPARAVEGYVAKVLKAGRTVSVCDQIEDPRDAKGIVKRAVVRTITPGTILEPDLLEDSTNNYLGAFLPNGKAGGLAFVDVTTGEFLVAQVEGDLRRVLHDEMTRMAPVELLIPKHEDETLLASLRNEFPNITITPRPEIEFETASSRELLLERFTLHTLKGLDLDNAAEAVGGAGAILSYIRQMQREMAPHLQMPRRYSPAGYVVLDGNTQRNLELIESLADKSRRGSLLNVLDRTRTSMGGRKLRHWILHPLLDIDEIRARLDAVDSLVHHTELRLQLRDLLKQVADLERLLGRITAKAGNARDIKALGSSLAHVPEIRGSLGETEAPLLQELYEHIDELRDVAEWIESAIVEEPPLALMEGGLFKDGHHDELDRLHELVRGGKDWIARLQKEERERTGIQNLKVGYNKVFGYYLEVSKGNVNLVPPDFERKQTLVNAERYITERLKSQEEEILTAQERMQRLEYDLFVILREKIADEAGRIQRTADCLAVLDVVLSLADVAVTKNYAKPTLDTSGEMHIRDGRHPVVEDLMSRGDFVPNDTHLDPLGARLQIITGPNMAGKSTYLRQVALITLMAQMGSFVPAAEARIGVVDRIFTRVGASDNLARGESTFMVEMIETAGILNTATANSLLILDEIGRGTSTFDGISIAWSVAEHIHDKLGAKTVFATHYHELTELGKQLEHAKNLNVTVREWGERIVFLYRIAEGGADHSYGIQVAKLAGLPQGVIKRARAILETLESGNTAALGLPQQMYLFGPQPAQEAPSAIEKELSETDIDALSPRDALEFLYHIKRLVGQKAGE